MKTVASRIAGRAWRMSKRTTTKASELHSGGPRSCTISETPVPEGRVGRRGYRSGYRRERNMLHHIMTIWLAGRLIQARQAGMDKRRWYRTVLAVH